MQLDTDEWVTSADAARVLGVSNQRVNQMAMDDGSLDVCRPWAHVVLIGKRSLNEWVTGQRQSRILPADARRFVLERTGQAHIQMLDVSDIEGWLVTFIADARPRWDAERQGQWAQRMTGRLLTSGAA